MKTNIKRDVIIAFEVTEDELEMLRFIAQFAYDSTHTGPEFVQEAFYQTSFDQDEAKAALVALLNNLDRTWSELHPDDDDD